MDITSFSMIMHEFVRMRQFFFLLLPRPPTSTLFPTRRSSDLLADLAGHAVKQLAAFEAALPAPDVEEAARRGHGLLDVGLASARDRRRGGQTGRTHV